MKSSISTVVAIFFLFSYPVSGRNVIQSLIDGFQKNNKDGSHRGAAWEDESFNQQRRRLLETGGQQNVKVDLDAATGTVPHIVTPEEKAKQEKAKEAQTCDGQMAIALVQANEKQQVAEKERDEALKEHTAAINKIVDLRAVLTEMEGKLAESATALKETKESAAQVLKETKQKAMEELEATQQKAQREQSSLKEEKAMALKQEKDQHQVELENLKQEKDDIIGSLQKKLKMTSEELQRTLEEELEKARTDRDEKLAKLQSKMDATVAELEKDRESKVLQLESDRDTQISMLKKQMEVEALDALKLLQTTKEEAKAYMVTQVNAVKAELAQAKADHERTLNEKNQKIKTLQHHAEKVLDKKSKLEEELNAAQAELDHWRSLYASRSYCNLTHISTDLYDSSTYAFQRSVDAGKQLYAESKHRAQKGAESATRLYKKQVDKHWPSIKPHYDEHVVGNYQKHVEPHLQEHVFPRFKQLAEWYEKEIVPRIDDGLKSIHKGYQQLIQSYGRECRSSFNSYNKASKEVDFFKEHPLPESLLQTWIHSCGHPEETIESAIYGFLLLLGIVFHRRILGVVWWILNIVLTILVTLTPLRFFISRRRKAPTNKSDNTQNGYVDDGPIPDITPSTSGSPDSIKSPGGPYRNTRSAKKPAKSGSA